MDGGFYMLVTRSDDHQDVEYVTVGRMKKVGGELIAALGLERLLVSGGNPRGGKCSISEARVKVMIYDR